MKRYVAIEDADALPGERGGELQRNKPECGFAVVANGDEGVSGDVPMLDANNGIMKGG